MDGRQVAEEILADVRARVLQLHEKTIIPRLTAISVGEDPASQSYLKIKQQKAEGAGIGFNHLALPAGTTEDDLREVIEQANKSKISGITIQLPLPDDLKKGQNELLNLIDPKKDVDVLTEENKTLYRQGRPRFYPPTIAAIFKLFERYEIDITAHNILIIGQGELVGKPLAAIFSNRGIDFQTADKNTNNIHELIEKATLIITATGQAELIKSNDVQVGVVIIDAGTAESEGKITGDVSSDVAQKASYFTPVPGGVGPVTVAMLLSNVVEAAENYFAD